MSGFFLLVAWFGAWPRGEAGFPNTPANRWFYEGIAEVKRDGLLVGSPDGLHRPSNTRYMAAVSLIYAMTNCRSLASAMPGEREKIVLLPPGDGRVVAYVSDVKALESIRRYLPFFRRAQRNFLPQVLELRRTYPNDVPLVAEVELALYGIRSLRLFRDVPLNHWAAGAVDELRTLGLLDGYPDGSFRGQAPGDAQSVCQPRSHKDTKKLSVPLCLHG